MNYQEKIKRAKELINFGFFLKKKYLEARNSKDTVKMKEYQEKLKDTYNLLLELEIYPSLEREINLDEII